MMSKGKYGKILIALVASTSFHAANSFTCPTKDEVAKRIDEFANQGGKAMFSLSGNITDANQPLYLVKEKKAKNNYNNKLLGTPQSLAQFLTANRAEMKRSMEKPNVSEVEKSNLNTMMLPKATKLNTNVPDVCAYSVTVGHQNAVVALSDKTE
jgi:hypothetical protein